MERKHKLKLGELFDRLTILQLKEVKIPEMKAEAAQEISDILHDINMILTNAQKKEMITAEWIRLIIILAQFNTHIWYNESEARKGNKDGNVLLLTHSINGIRVKARNMIEKIIDPKIIGEIKIDCLAAEFSEQWTPSGL